MHVDTSQRLWSFFDLYGSTLKVRLLGTQFPSSSTCRVPRASVASPVGRPLNGMHSVSLHNVHKMHHHQFSSSAYSSNSGCKRSSMYHHPQQQQQQPLSSVCKAASSEKRVNVEGNTYQHHNALNNSLYQSVEPQMKSSSSNSGTVLEAAFPNMLTSHSNRSFLPRFIEFHGQ